MVIFSRKYNHYIGVETKEEPSFRIEKNALLAGPPGTLEGWIRVYSREDGAGNKDVLGGGGYAYEDGKQEIKREHI